MSEQEARISCRYCGSNNFAGTATCWQCNRPLVSSPNVSPSAFQQPVVSPQLYARPLETLPSEQAVPTVDYTIADRAAIAMGLLFPLIGYPVGIAFLMLDQPRKIQLGRAMLLWSTVGLVLSFIGTLIVAAPLMSLGKQLIPSDPVSHLSLPSDGSN